MWKERYLPIAAGLSIVFLVWLAVRAVANRHLLFGVEATVYDHWVRQLPKAASSQCVIVYVSERDIQAWDQYPMSDLKMAELLTRLSAMRPRVIGVDIYRDINTPDGRRQTIDRPALDSVLRHGDGSAAETPPIVAGCLLPIGSDPGVAAPSVLADDPARQGFVNLDIDADGVARKYTLFREDPGHPGDVRSSMAAILASDVLASDDADQKISALPRAEPDDLFYRGGVNSRGAGATQTLSILLDFRGPATYARFDAEDVIAGHVDRAAIEGKAVFVGVITPSIKDYIATPLDPKMPGVQIHAQACDQLLRMVAGQPGLVSVPPTRQGLFALLAGLIGWGIGWWVRSPWKAVVSLALLFAGVWWAGWLSLEHFRYLAVVPPLLNGGLTAGLVTSYRSYRERADRKVMDGLVDRMMSKRIARTLWSRRGELLENGHLKPQVADATVLFSDLQGFTDISERLDADVLLKWLNTYFQTMSDLVEQHGGVVNKYVGDQVMAVFGPPLPSSGEEAARLNAWNAIRCALAMRDALEHLHALWLGESLETAGWSAAESRQLKDAIAENGDNCLCIRVGISSGKLVAGSLGSRDRLEYTVIGAVVNLASRLEGWDKSRMEAGIAPGNCRILVNRVAYELTRDAFTVKCLGAHAIRGMEEPVDIYSVLGVHAAGASS